METSKYALLGIAESLNTHGRPGQIGYMLFELLNDVGYSLTEIKEISQAIDEHAEHMQMIPDRKKVAA